jgi:hypothetical protein
VAEFLQHKADIKIVMTNYLARFMQLLDDVRKICKDKEVNPAIRVHAAGYLMKLASLRHELPKHILDETEPTAEESLQKLEVEFITPDEAASTDALVG